MLGETGTEYRDDMTEKEKWAEDHGYYHWTCRDCGQSGWTDTTPDCACREESCVGDPEEGEFRCDNCGELFRPERKYPVQKFCQDNCRKAVRGNIF